MGKKFALVRKIILQLLRAELWGDHVKGRTLPPPVFKAVKAVADDQAVAGLVMSGVVDANVHTERRDAAMALASIMQAQDASKAINESVVKLCRLLKANDIPFYVFKGQTIAALYPKPDLRAVGDIDFYVPQSHFAKAQHLIEQQWQLTMTEEDEEMHYAFEKWDTHYEMHFRMVNFTSRKLERRFNEMLSQAKTVFVDVAGEQVPTMEAELNIVYTFLHLYNHFMELGIGLRQLSDMAMLIHHHSASISYERLYRMLESLDVTKAFNAFGAYLTDVIGLKDERFESYISSDDHKYVGRIDKIVWERGNFGYHGWKNERGSLKFYIETLGRRIGNYTLLYKLSPTEIKARTFREIPDKIVKSLRKL